jgi:hypothetical protein
MTDIRLIEYEPGKWRIDRREIPVARSTLPTPHVISDTMPPTEQVDGKFYESKSAFRRVGRALGLTEVGTEKFKPKQRSTADPAVKHARRQAIHTAIEKYKAGHRPGGRHA